MRKLSYEEIFRLRPDLESIEREGRFPITVVAENIRSLYNVGSIFRTSDAARIEKLILAGFTGRPPRNEISKTALGAEHTVPWEYRKNTAEALHELKERGVSIVVVEQTDESVPYFELQYPRPVCLVVGNEVEGVSEEALKLADHAVEIPMYGTKHSLNVGVAYGIVVFEVLFQWLGGQPEKAKFLLGHGAPERREG
ncbi:MAG TPA: TrmH family RNA methyltransferase [Bacteroidetes bacterium]|nr:TrmH family RNA methyltransferase [Bacteroidota bacterium]